MEIAAKSRGGRLDPHHPLVGTFPHAGGIAGAVLLLRESGPWWRVRGIAGFFRHAPRAPTPAFEADHEEGWEIVTRPKR
ncbi:MAG: hypothetical protein VX563_06190 [Planctomycetota bacterium]|nr:hypothetical protein [Planctomycetota bacterium]MED6334915.1 hypothetical protein [Planctomycetota bacterium]